MVSSSSMKARLVSPVTRAWVELILARQWPQNDLGRSEDKTNSPSVRVSATMSIVEFVE